jgi:hypothetical protein
VKEKLVGLAPIAGLIVGGDVDGVGAGDSNCVKPGISAANLFIDRPPAFPFPEVEELPPPAAASGIVPVDAVPVPTAPEVVPEVGAMLMVARGMVAPIVLLSDDVSVD